MQGELDRHQQDAEHVRLGCNDEVKSKKDLVLKKHDQPQERSSKFVQQPGVVQWDAEVRSRWMLAHAS